MKRTINDIHKTNFKLIKQYGLKVGDRLKLKKECDIHCGAGSIFTIESINSYYGWVVLSDEYFPQEVEILMEMFEKVEDPVKAFKRNVQYILETSKFPWSFIPLLKNEILILEKNLK